MQAVWFDCFSGISGDMTLGALLHAGGDEANLRETLSRLSISGWELQISSTSQNGIGAIDVTVAMPEEQGHGRHLHHIEEILIASDIPQSVRDRAFSVFTRLAEAEAKVHQTTVDRIHFHEVGAVDAIVDIVGSCTLMDQMGIERVFCSPLPAARGFVECMHGLIPLPAPATLELLSGVPVYNVDIEGELVTPTGASLMVTLAKQFGPMPAMKLSSIGYGSGKKRFGNRPNLLRVVTGELTEPAFTGSEEIIVMETNLDDLSPQYVEPLTEALMDAGALDVFTTAIQMKKMRQGVLLTVIASPARQEAVADVIFRNAPTLGVRLSAARRLCLDRRWETVQTEFGPVRVKVGFWKGAETSATPEYEDVRAVSKLSGSTSRQVYDSAVAAYRLRKQQ